MRDDPNAKLPKWVPMGLIPLILVAAVMMIWYVFKVAPHVKLNPAYLQRQRCEQAAQRAYNECMDTRESSRHAP